MSEQRAARSRLKPESVIAAPTPLRIDISSRQQARAFFNAVYEASDGDAIDWSGSLSGTPRVSVTGTAGSTSNAYKAAVGLRINWFRAMAGVPAAIGIDGAESAMDQDAALMMAANDALNHFPPASWLLYSSDGATAAGNSNLSLGNFGPDAITSGYICDSGSNNAAAGHRRWILYPQTLTMATGDIPDTGSFLSANATWVVDSNFGAARPTVRDNYVAWPPPGYVPYQVIFPRWSFSYPGADFSAASVSMTSNGSAVPVSLEAPVNPAYGENTLVWDYNRIDGNSVGLPASKPNADIAYTVQVNGVLINGKSQNFSYAVIEFDPAVAGPGDAPPQVSGPTAITMGESNLFTVAGIPGFESGFEFRALAIAPFSASFGAEGGLQGAIANVSGAIYNPIDPTRHAGTGSASYHLAMPDFTTQILTLPGTYVFPGGPASLSFASQLGWATSGQVARVQVSLDDGVTWSDLYAQAGTGSAGEGSFVTRVIPLDGYGGMTFMVRFAYTLVAGSPAFPQTTSGVGWNIDIITFSGIETVAAGPTSAQLSGSTFSYSPTAAGPVGIQARGVLFNNYPLAWGPVLFQTAATTGQGLPEFTLLPQPQTVATGSTVAFQVSVSTAASFQWYLNSAPIFGATSRTFVVRGATSATAGNYSCLATNGGGSTMSAGALLTVLNTTNIGRLINLSILSNIQGSLSMGFVIGGAGTSGSESLLIRGLGPSIGPGTAFGVPGVITDPVLTVAGQNSHLTIASNSGWGANLAAVIAADNATGAFALSDPTSLDSALVVNQPSVTGGYTVTVAGKSGDSGYALTEVYDDTSDYTPASTRLINLSCLTRIVAGGALDLGFVIGGATSKTVLVRAAGPALSTLYGIGGVMPDPQLQVSPLGSSSTILAFNAGWGGDPQIASAATSVGAYVFPNPNSLDSAVLVTLPPGPSTVQVSSASGLGGTVLVEIYDLP